MPLVFANAMSDTLPQPGLESLSKSFEPVAIEAHCSFVAGVNAG